MHRHILCNLNIFRGHFACTARIWNRSEFVGVTRFVQEGEERYEMQTFWNTQKSFLYSIGVPFVYVPFLCKFYTASPSPYRILGFDFHRIFLLFIRIQSTELVSFWETWTFHVFCLIEQLWCAVIDVAWHSVLPV